MLFIKYNNYKYRDILTKCSNIKTIYNKLIISQYFQIIMMNNPKYTIL